MTPRDEEDRQRLKNTLLFKFYGTDKEMEEAMPFIGLVALIGLVIFLAFYLTRG